LDPHQGRLDLVPGENRAAGAFAYGYSGAPWQFYSFAYEGYLQNVSTLAHEAGHAVHYTTLANKGIEPLYYDGPSYITETVAMVNELLLIDHLYVGATNLEMKTFFLEEFLKKTIRFLYLNFIAHLEATIYEKVASGELQTADDLDLLTKEMGSKYNVYYEIHPEYRGAWNVIHHFYTHPMYNVNYVIAGALSLKIFLELQNDPAFVTDYLKLVHHGFDRPGPRMIEETIGLDMADPALLADCFGFIDDKITQLKRLYQEAGVSMD